ncbi:hypothetical protein CSC70_05995 [Pseudoxanthomonas kalamensis DSM 18571]|uniref:hypothetical protein n=1 Tax=Pseudoxanthomonas kalamensis TaxID=289483 RepID=UPI001391D1D3|nr:hypothetical protein [Pseudoxanthomonas kalamensis]KAF1711452.1 hypothetical protein CSC70_05995 [Pseudoxanthomonas kalamensis DSM 18571]
MDNPHFLARDEAGNLHRVEKIATSQITSGARRDNAPVYRLRNGSWVRRVDTDTFQVIDTGAYITAVRE